MGNTQWINEETVTELKTATWFADTQLPRNRWEQVSRTLLWTTDFVSSQKWPEPVSQWSKERIDSIYLALLEKGLTPEDIASIREVWGMCVSTGKSIATLIEQLAEPRKGLVSLVWGTQRREAVAPLH